MQQFTLRSHHKIKSTHGKTFMPYDKVKDFILSFKRDVKKCIVKVVSKESDKKPKGSGSNAVSKMVKNLQVPPKRVLQAKPQPKTSPTTAAASPPAKKKMPTAPPAPRISGYTNANGVTNTNLNANRDKNTTNTAAAADRVSRDNAPRTSGYLDRNLFNPNLLVSATATGVNFRLNKRKYPEDDISYPKAKGRANNVDDDDLDTASQLARNQNLFFDDSSSVCSQDDQTLPDIKAAFLNRFSLVPNTYFHKMLKEYTAFGNADQREHNLKISWEKRNPTTNSILADVCKGFTTPL